MWTDGSGGGCVGTFPWVAVVALAECWAILYWLEWCLLYLFTMARVPHGLIGNKVGTWREFPRQCSLQTFFSKSENIDNLFGIPRMLPIFLKNEKKFCTKILAGLFFHFCAQNVTN